VFIHRVPTFLDRAEVRLTFIDVMRIRLLHWPLLPVARIIRRGLDICAANRNCNMREVFISIFMSVTLTHSQICCLFRDCNDHRL
jgi:hypothetical protein